MTKQELIERIYRTRGLEHRLTKRAVHDIVDAVFSELGDFFVKARVTKATSPRFSYPGFGTFTKKRRVARNGRNPQTGAPMKIPATHTLTFSPSADLRTLIKHRK